MNFLHRFCLVLAALAALAAAPAAGALSDDDKACLKCHSREALKKDLGKGESLSLHVRGDEFASSVHAGLGCIACHSNVDPKTHPGAGERIGSAREYALAKVAVCSECHEDKAKLFDGSIHASILRTGNLYAPVCTDCHGAHAVQPKTALQADDQVSCRSCHDDIYQAYAGSMHGLARGKPGAAKAPICVDCHRAHDVSPAATGTSLREACLGCHAGAPAAHEKWLPNTKRHLEAVACAACHAPAAERRVDLRLYDPSTRQQMTDPAGDSLDAKALWDLLRGVSRDGTPTRATLAGRLEVRSGAEAHLLTAKSKAIKDCVTCHKQGAAAFQNVTISIIGPDGRPVRYEAQKEVLSNPASVDAVSDFYVIGGTRIKLLDALLALALAAGISAPIGHLLLRKLLRRKSAERPQAGSRTP
jgi:predicted CXXCH cytochrome family protein